MFNKYRNITEQPQKELNLLRDIESISRLKATAVINNSNLGAETNIETVMNSLDYAKKTAALCGLELKFTTYPDWINPAVLTNDVNFIPVKRYVKPVWE